MDRQQLNDFCLKRQITVASTVYRLAAQCILLLRDAGTYGDVGTGPHQFLADKLALLQSGLGEVDYCTSPRPFSADKLRYSNQGGGRGGDYCPHQNV